MDKKLLWALGVCTALFVTGCSENTRQSKGEWVEIDVETAFKQPQELSLNDLGETFTYVPLETVDESLIHLNSGSNLSVTEDFIFIADMRKPILCFDRKTGRFLRQIGGIGQGPMEYSNGASFVTDPIGKRIYVTMGNGFQCYDYEGKFQGTVTCVDKIQSMVDAYFFAGDRVFHHVNIPDENTEVMTYCYDLKTWQPLDSLMIDEKDKPKEPRTMALPIMGAEVMGGQNFLVQYGDVYTYGRRLNNAFWISDGEVYMKDAFCDTIFRVKGLHQKEPVAAFRLGEYGGYGRFETSGFMSDKYLMPNLKEGKNHIYFILEKELYNYIDLMKARRSLPVNTNSCGVYDKRTGKVKLQLGLGFKHPLEGMPPAYVFNSSTDGAFVVVYQADQLASAREEIPEEKQPEWLKNLKEDDNPVVLLVQ